MTFCSLCDVSNTPTLELSSFRDIVNKGFNHSHLEIDDNWESCYGDAKFESDKFPDPTRMVTEVNSLGFRTSLWIHPFINTECESYAEVG